MSISQFPPASNGGAAGGASLPEGAVAKLVEGKLTSNGYSYPETLQAGTYRINASGNSVIANFGDNQTSETISTSSDVTITANESNLSFDVASNFAGDATVLVDLPAPISAWSQTHSKSHDFAVSPNGEHMIMLRGQASNNNYISYGMRTPKGSFRYMGQLFIGSGDARYSAAAVDDNGFGYIGYATGSNFDHRIRKINEQTGVDTEIFNANNLGTQFLNSNTGSSGLAVSPDGQTIVYVAYRQNRAVVTSDGGANWTEVTLPGSAWSSSVQNGYNGPMLKYQNGYFMQPGDNSNGLYYLSTDGITWSSHAVPGASQYVMDFATDGTTFMFATGDLGAIYKTTNHANFTAMAVSNLANSRYWNVEYAAGKWVSTNQGNSSSGDWVVSDDDGATWTLVNPNDYSMPYGNQQGFYNARWQNANQNSIYGVQGIRIQKLKYDSKFNTVAANHAYYTTTSYAIHDLANLNLDDYYMWIYSHYLNDPGVNYNPGLYDIIYSPEMGRWYYTTNNNDNWGQSNVFSYDANTGNIRTEPMVRSGQYVIVSSDVSSSIYSVASFGTSIVYSGENSSNQWAVWRCELSAQDLTDGIFWRHATALQYASAGNWSGRLKPLRAPNGGGLFGQTYSTTTSYFPNMVFDSNGVWRYQWYPATDTINFVSALESGSVAWDTVNKTVTAGYGAYKYTDLPYETGTHGTFPSSETAYDDYQSSLPTGTSYSYQSGNNVVYWNSTNDTVSVSTNGGASQLTYPALNDPPSVIFESQGVFYLVSTLNSTGRIYSISDFSTSNYVELSDIGVPDYPRVGWQHVVGSPYSSEANPVMFTTTGKIIQLFSNANYQPPSNLFVYDMNLEVL